MAQCGVWGGAPEGTQEDSFACDNRAYRGQSPTKTARRRPALASAVLHPENRMQAEH